MDKIKAALEAAKKQLGPNRESLPWHKEPLWDQYQQALKDLAALSATAAEQPKPVETIDTPEFRDMCENLMAEANGNQKTWAYELSQWPAFIAHINARITAPAPASKPEVPAAWHKFVTDCAGTAGGMVSGNNLSRLAARLLFDLGDTSKASEFNNPIKTGSRNDSEAAQDIVGVLNEPEKYLPLNFDTPARANAVLLGLCQDAADEIKKLRAAQPAPARNMREAFEAWLDSNFWPAHMRHRQENGDYTVMAVNQRWYAWQAAFRALVGQPAQAVMEHVGHVDMQSAGPGDRIRWTNGALPHGTPLFATAKPAQAVTLTDEVERLKRDLREYMLAANSEAELATEMKARAGKLEAALRHLVERIDAWNESVAAITGNTYGAWEGLEDARRLLAGSANKGEN